MIRISFLDKLDLLKTSKELLDKYVESYLASIGGVIDVINTVTAGVQMLINKSTGLSNKEELLEEIDRMMIEASQSITRIAGYSLEFEKAGFLLYGLLYSYIEKLIDITERCDNHIEVKSKLIYIHGDVKRRMNELAPKIKRYEKDFLITMNEILEQFEIKNIQL